MIKVYRLDTGDAKMWAAAESIVGASMLMLDTYDNAFLEEGFEIKPVPDEEIDENDVHDETTGQMTSWKSIIEEPGRKFPCIIGESD
ncbi:hypothetical protein [Desulfosporosinus youngiae]|uniref:Uncharacterized protein n=1 Tax=Desulfosporosinus youngiae DSM 17734 TaxID=768710 RepID=H5Y237_9FIRM|nr:hypothetical protein [Desulfosporosinus youngiae]EHQ88235.1 hypothetical protein DesyoDRAFT_1064 [Desulfosporosinus youngiae DSM 17734]